MKRSYWPWLLIVGIVCLIVGILVWRGFREEEHPHKHGEGCHCYCFEQQGKEEDAHKHDAEHPVHIGHGAEKSSQVTVWTERFEIFLEHAFIVANTPTKFITHVSDLQTLKPRGKGPVTFILRRGSETPDKHIARAPVRDGIYIPELTFPLPGEWSLSLVIPLEGKDHLVELPPFEVYGSHEEVDRAPFPKEIAGISFLKEQQWKMLTRAEPVGRRKAIGQETLVVPESALIDENGKPVAFVQVAGETFEKRYLELGNRDNDFVEVLSGLSDGERVVTKGAYAIAEAERKKEHPHRHGEGCHCWCFEEGHPHRHDEGVHHEH
ncbi:MAG: hypothetical protein DDT30_01043 [Dehalococcoidia bacterium]|nr:hypothetical protein [Bacillota bacterium]